LIYKRLLKPILFQTDPEKAHHSTIGMLARTGKSQQGLAVMRALYGVDENKSLEQTVFGLTFKNPIGLAAGLDKNAEAIPAFSSIGLGFIEVGTLTPRPQPGNEQPRLFRLPQDEALINRMGFNNRGAKAAAAELATLRERPVPVGINIGKNKTTPNEDAAEDYKDGIQILYPYADYFVINISSPNTPDLRNLQHGEELAKLVSIVQQEVKLQAVAYGVTKPVLVKIAPDLTDDELKETVEILVSLKASGIIATNTTVERSGLTHPHSRETGGLSGKPLTEASTEVIRKVYRLTEGKVPIIGVGGIFNGQDAYDKILAGATLVQVYTGLIYEGPGISRKINKDLLRLLNRDGYSHLSEAIGQKAK
jgi:dihydroorotate dehydrogenase